MSSTAVRFARSRVRAFVDWFVGAFFVLAPEIGLDVLGVPRNGYVSALLSLFGAALIFKGFVQHALADERGAPAPLVVANAVFEGLLAALLALVVVRGPAVSPAVQVALCIFALEMIIDAWAWRHLVRGRKRLR